MTGFSRVLRAFVLALAAVSAPAFADNPELSARLGADAKTTPLKIGKFDIAVTVTGDTAHSVVTAEFLNPSNTPKEGEFVFDLPKHSVVTGYALDVNGQMVDGVLVGEHEARKTYEQAVRRGIDPGLAEVTRSGAFKTHVFPILPGRGRTIRVSFDTPIEAAQEFRLPLNKEPSPGWRLPLHTKEPVGRFSFKVETNAVTGLMLQGIGGGSNAVIKKGRDFTGDINLKDTALDGDIVLTPQGSSPVLLARHANSQVFFEINDAVPPSAKAATKPERVRLYWDSSLSRRDADLKNEIALVGKYIAAVHPAHLDIVFFAEGTPKLRSFTSPKPEEVEAVLKVTDYQGGTSLKSLFTGNFPEADACLLFSDGTVTSDSWKTARSACPLFAVTSAPDANRPLLGLLARKSGGAFVDLTATGPEAALQSLTRQTPAVSDVRAKDGSEIDFVTLPSEGNRIRIIGRLPDDGDVTVKLARAGETSRVYKIDRNAVANTDTLGSLWAIRHIDDMLADEHPDKQALVDFSRRFSVASTGVSFVVFERLDDYVDAGVEPPAALGKQMLAEYRARKAAAEEEEKRADRERLDDVIKLWGEEKTWWAGPVKPKKRKAGRALPFVPPPDIVIQTDAPPPSNTITTQSRVAAPPPPPTAGDRKSEEVIVTGAHASDIGRLPDSNVAEALQRVPGIRVDRPAGSDKSISVAIADWNPDRPYIKALNAAAPEMFWTVYRDEEKKFGTQPSFYLDVAEFFARHDRKADAVRIVLNALELPSADVTTQTIVADRLMRYGDVVRAAWFYERVLYLEGDRPQPRRNLALALTAKADSNADKAEKITDLKRALGLYNEIITRAWNESYDGIEVISLMEANRIIAKLKALGVNEAGLDKRLIALLDVDLRIVMEWNTDATDMDLWVDEPTGDRCMYSHPATVIGGRLSNDMTSGYGPEQYLLRKAPNGTYTVRVNVYASDRLNPNGATAVRAHIFRNWGRADEREQTLEIELTRADKDAHLIGTVKVTGSDVTLPAVRK